MFTKEEAQETKILIRLAQELIDVLVAESPEDNSDEIQELEKDIFMYREMLRLSGEMGKEFNRIKGK